MRTLVSPSAGSTIVDKVKTYEGGTGQITKPAALAVFDGVPKESINKPGGVLGLDETGKVPVNNLPLMNLSTIVVEGPVSVVKGSISTYVVNNYDAFTDYDLIAVSGDASINEDVISFTAPSIPQESGFILNGRKFTIQVTDYCPVAPVITAVDGPGNPVSLVATTSAFAMQGSSDTHLNSDWQVSTDANFLGVVASSVNDIVSKTNWTTFSLAKNTKYYVRARHRSSSGAVSDWSNGFAVVTKANYLLNKEEAKLTASDKAAGDMFGFNTEMTTDGTRVVVSAPTADVGAVDTGAVYVFVRTGSTWVQEAKLVASDRAANDWFGHRASISKDGTRVVVGAYLADAGAVDTGAAYVFSRTGSTWIQEAKLIASDRLTSDYFGCYVDSDDTCTRVAVGAYNADVGAIDTGAVYIFMRNGSMWTQEAKLVASDRAVSDWLGYRTCITGDGTRVIASAHGADGGIVNSGAAYIFVRNGTVWTQEAKLVASDRAVNDITGATVDISGDGTRAVIGSSEVDVGAVNTGAVYVFVRNGSVWTQEAKLVASDRLAGDFFSLMSLDYNGNRIIVSAYMADAGAVDTGAVYVFIRNGTVWTQESKLVASDRLTGDRLGDNHGPGLSGDSTRAAIGAPLADVSGLVNSGAVYIFST